MLNDLKRHRDAMAASFHLRDVVRDDARTQNLTHDTPAGTFDFSRHIVTDETLDLFNVLLDARDVFGKRDRMIQGERINHTENRSVQHMALRSDIGDEAMRDYVADTHKKIKNISETIRGDQKTKDVIHIGIGGSDLGPKMMCDALAHQSDGPRVHFLSSIDGLAVQAVLQVCDPRTTAIIVVSKTFTTQETMLNLKTVRDWAPQAPVYAVTGAMDTALSHGILPDHILPLKNAIGGRFSLWSAAGMGVTVSLGFEVFQAVLSGAKDADDAFMNASSVHHIPVMMACLSYWYHTVFGYPGQGVVPYTRQLRHFPAYLQQLEMESNGKAADHPTAPIVFGDTGTESQHAFFQHLHQSPTVTPVDFIMHDTPVPGFEMHHNIMNANATAQAQALAVGQDNTDAPHRHFPGNRPSTMITLSDITPYTLGYLCATYEHKVFVHGALLDVNSFDQFGVALGKAMAEERLNP